MSHCPNCKAKLRLTDWKPNCPHCNVNLGFFNFEEEFLEDAKYTELGYAKLRVTVARFKGAFIGSKIAIIKLIAAVLPLLSLLVPFMRLTLKFPFFENQFQLGIIGIVNMVTQKFIFVPFGLAGGLTFGNVFDSYIITMAGFTLCLLVALLHILFELLSAFHVKRCAKITCVLSCIGILLAGATIFFSQRTALLAAEHLPARVSASLGFGGFVMILVLALSCAINYIVIKKGLEMQYKEGDLYRVEVAKKLKNGELKISDLPQPIFETAEEREQRLKEEGEEASA